MATSTQRKRKRTIKAVPHVPSMDELRRDAIAKNRADRIAWAKRVDRDSFDKWLESQTARAVAAQQR